LGLTFQLACVDFHHSKREVFLMARPPKPWYRKARKCWCVNINGTHHNLGPNKKQAFEQFHKLMSCPDAEPVSSLSFAALADRYLDWVQRKRASDTYEWYRYRLERFVRKYPHLKAEDVRPHHIEAWVDDYV
jgi:hypothetical protein